MHVELAFSGHTVNLCDRVVFLQAGGSFRQGLRRGFNFEVAGDRPADFLRVDDRCVFLDDPALLERLHARAHGDARNPDLLADVRIGLKT